MQNLGVNGFKPQAVKPLKINNQKGQGVAPQSITNNSPNYSAAAYQGGFPKPKAR